MSLGGSKRHPSDVGRRARQGGYTLIHLLVGIGVAGSVIAAVSPNVSSVMRIYAIRSGARQIYSELQNLRMAAVTENTTYTFTVDGGGASYFVQKGTETPVNKTLDAASQGVTISAANAIAFASNGTASTTATVTVLDSAGAAISVGVAPAGRIRIQ